MNTKDYTDCPIISSIAVTMYVLEPIVFTTRQGSKLLDVTEYRGLNSNEVITKAVDYYNTWNPVSIMIDSIGTGAGVFDSLDDLKLPVEEVVPSNSASDSKTYGNVRAQIYGKMIGWLANKPDILGYRESLSQIKDIHYKYNDKMQLMLLPKGLDKTTSVITDAVALTFA